MNERDGDFDPRVARLMKRYVDEGLLGATITYEVVQGKRHGPLRPVAAALAIGAFAIALVLSLPASGLPQRVGNDVTGAVPSVAGSLTPPGTIASAGSLPSTTPTPSEITARAVPLSQLLSCDDPGRARGGSDISVVESGVTARSALDAFVAASEMAIPRSGYTDARRDATEVTFVYQEDGRVKAAALVRLDGTPEANGAWAVAEYRVCDTRDFAPTTDLGPTVRGWEHPDLGLIVDRTGPTHCGWESVRLITLDGIQYGRDPDAVLDRRFRGTFAVLTSPPDSAAATGYRNAEAELWIDKAAGYLYVVGSERTEQWPAPIEPVVCR